MDKRWGFLYDAGTDETDDADTGQLKRRRD